MDTKSKQGLDYEHALLHKLRVNYPQTYILGEMDVKRLYKKITTIDILINTTKTHAISNKKLVIAIQVTIQQNVNKSKIITFNEECNEFANLENKDILKIFLSREGINNNNILLCANKNIKYIKSVNKLFATLDPYLPITKSTFKIRPIQLDIIEAIKKNPIGFVQIPTGLGKTNAMLLALIEHLNAGAVVVWFTEYTAVLDVFNEINVAKLKYDGVIPKNTNIMTRRDLAEDKTILKNTIIVATIDSLYTSYKKLLTPCNITHNYKFVFDECHHITGSKIYEIMTELKQYCSMLVGLSATPAKDANSMQLFNNTCIISKSLQKAMEDNEIPTIKYAFLTVNNINKDDGIDKNDKRIHEFLKNVIDKTTTRKGIAWCKNTENGKAWYEILKQYEEEWNIKIFYIDSTLNNYDKIRHEFYELNENALMIAVDMLKEGVDINYVDFAGFLDSGIHGTHVLIQAIGRILRYREGKIAHFFDLIVFNDALQYEKDLLEKINSYLDVNTFDVNGNNKLMFPTAKKSLDGRNLAFSVNGKEFAEFDIICEHNINLFDRIDAVAIANWLNTRGLSWSAEEIKNYLVSQGFKNKEDAIKHLDAVLINNTNKKLSMWWENNQDNKNMDWYYWLNIDKTEFYQTLEEARTAIKYLECNLTHTEVAKYNNYDIYMLVLRVKNKKLPPDPIGLYGIKSLFDICKIDKQRLANKMYIK